ncbi:alpha/beta hydrolase [Halobacillus fulvus]|nr:alpha/beta hydrolase [Halobacillus fulvus]
MTLTTERYNIHTLGTGDQTVIFAHGFGADQSVWRKVVSHFQEDFRLVLFDYVGSGDSDIDAYDRQKYAKLEGYAEDILDICESLNLEDCIFVGHSVSSMIGVLAANKKPKLFKELIMIGPSPRYLNDEGYTGGFERSDIDDLLHMMEMNFIGWASYMAPAATGAPIEAPISRQMEKQFSENHPAITRNFLSATLYSDHREDVKKLKVPSLIIQCAEDSFVPLAVGNYLHENIPNSSLAIIEAKGHYPQLSHPDETVDLIDDYLKERGYGKEK